jgi:tRNA modification GTPase
MTLYRADTIVACATPAGRGAIAIVRCSGRGALAVAGRIFRPRSIGPLEPWRMRLGTALHSDGVTAVDETLGVFFPAPHSFTGEDTFEVHCHGSPVVVEQIVGAAIAAGARSAERGEFTRRAVLNGKLDLLQAEAIADLIDARMAAGTAAAWSQLQGALSERLQVLRSSLLGTLSELEARIDFTDDELPEEDIGRRLQAMESAARELTRLRDGLAAARRRREGLRVVFAGRPNAGKSSLVNRLLGSGRMIVSDEPGTTRDAVEEAVDLGGVAFVLTDTAGIRAGTGPAEAEAVSRARERLREADLRVLVIDGSLTPGREEEALWEEVSGADTVVVLNKSDLGATFPDDWRNRFRAGSAAVLSASARTGEGCAELAEALLVQARQRLEAEPAGISRVRHRTALDRSLQALRRAIDLSRSDEAGELAVIELREALAELASITEAVDNEEVLDRIFAEFCIGK